jgi:glycosyltransferase involved in cell wall biosynthesis
MSLRQAKVALVFDWMTVPGGAEKVNQVLHEMFPEAPIFTSVFNPDKFPEMKDADIRTSFIQNLPLSKKRHQFYITMMPYAYELFDLSEFDIVISSSHACAKGVITKPETLHLCYCHSPMRYAWDNWQQYIGDYKMSGFIKRWGKKRMHKLRIWDRLSADRVDHFVANSNTTEKRIGKYYRRPADVVFPPINCKKFKVSPTTKGYFLAAGRLTPYKKFDLIIETFNQLGLPLKVVGTGIAEDDLKRQAKSNIQFTGYVSDHELKRLYSECEALIFPQKEDFGITPIEVMAAGRPVIAFNQGGALDYITSETGIFFNKQTPESLKKAISSYQDNRKTFDSQKIRNHALKFDTSEFKKQLRKSIQEHWDKK